MLQNLYGYLPGFANNNYGINMPAVTGAPNIPALNGLREGLGLAAAMGIVSPNVMETPSAYYVIGSGGPPQPCVLPPQISCTPQTMPLLSCTPQHLPFNDGNKTCSAMMNPREREGRRGCKTCGRPYISSSRGYAYCREFPDDWRDEPRPITFEEKYNIKTCHHECLPEEVQKEYRDRLMRQDEMMKMGKAKTSSVGRAIMQKRKREAARTQERPRGRDGPVTLLAPYKHWETQRLLPGVQAKLTEEQKMDGVVIPHSNKYEVRINTPLHPISEVFEMEMMRKTKHPKVPYTPAGLRIDSLILPTSQQEKRKNKMAVMLELRTPRKELLHIPPEAYAKPVEEQKPKPVKKKKKKKKKK